MIRAVDQAPPASLPAGARLRRNVPRPPTKPPPAYMQRLPPRPKPARSDDGTESSEDSVPLPRRQTKRAPVEEEDDDDDIDESLWDIVNQKKLRQEPLVPRAEDSLESADSSERFAGRKSVGDAFKSRSTSKRPSHILPLPSRPVRAPTAPRRRPPPPPPDDESDLSDYSSDDDEDDGRRIVVDPLEEITIKAVRKGKLLSRIRQMEMKGVRPSKNFTLKSNEEELMVEVARLEVMAERAIRVTQGRSALLTTTRILESGANVIDRKNYLPMKLGLKGFSDVLLKDIDQYDDCLERGVAETIGPASSRIWWVELMWILLPSMFMYSVGNNGSGKDAKRDPEYQKMLASEYAKEMSDAERKKTAELGKRLQEVEAENKRLRENSTRAMPPAASSKPSPLPPPIRNEHPLGDLPANPTETAKMQALLSKHKPVVNARVPPPSQRSGRVIDMGDDDDSTTSSTE